MAITRNAKRAVKVSTRKRVTNDIIRRKMKETVKAVRKDVTEKNTKEIPNNLALAFQALDKAAKRGTIKKGNANRKKARLARAIAKMEQK